jgi:hypothetical protein
MKIQSLRKNEYFYIIVSLLLYSIMSFVIFKRGLILSPDSEGYLNPLIIRSPIYPLLIKFCKLLAGINFGSLLLIIQIILGLGSVFAFSLFLFKQFSLDKWIILLLSLFLFVPYIVSMQIGNTVLTEPLAYPLFLFTIKYLFEAFREKTLRNFIISFCFATVLILTRSQFLFLYPLIALLISYLLLFTSINKKVLMKISVTFIGFIIGFFIIEMTYHAIADGKFVRTPFTGIQLSTNAIYISSVKDSTIFSDKQEKEIFISIIKATENKNLTLSSFASKSDLNYMSHYDTAYNEICWRTMFPILRDNLKYDSSSEMYLEIDKITLSISKKLIVHNWKPFLNLYFKNIYTGMGGLIVITWTILTFFCLLILFFNGNRSVELIFLLTIYISHFFNLALVSLVEPVMKRYSFYTEVLLFVIFTSILLSLLQNVKAQKLFQL